VKTKVRQKLAQYKRRLERRLDKNDLTGCDRPMLTASNIHYEVGGRTRAIAAGGIGAMHQMVKYLELDQEINRHLQLLKVHAPYHESDHVLSIAYNFLAGGTCLEHLEAIRTDEVFLDALGARRLPDPTTAGDFCRRFSPVDSFTLQEVINGARVKVWKQQPDAFFAEAVIDGDGTMAETYGECKQGMDLNYEGKWGYHPLIISLANTGEPLYVVNRSGNRPSHENAATFFTQAAAWCREAGFRRIVLRGDTDFSQTTHLDAWDADDVKFVFGMDAMRNLVEIAENLPENAWRPLTRHARYQVKTQPRTRPEKVKERIVQERGLTNIRLQGEAVAEFRYRPVACRKAYRIVVVRKDLQITGGQRKLFENEPRCFFYITNEWEKTREQVVEQANGRCHQENLIEQIKNGVPALTAPVDSLASNGAYMVMATLAWSLKAWAALLLPEDGRWKERHTQEKQKLLRMDFATFRRVWMNMPAQIISHQPQNHLPSALLESLAASLLPPARSIAAPAAMLSRSPGSRGLDAPVCRHAQPRKKLPHARPTIRKPLIGLADLLKLCTHEAVRLSRKPLSAYACLRSSSPPSVNPWISS
jgi:hypothetical protein